MNELTVFKHDVFGEIRSVVINDEPWFVGKDVATALGYSNHRKALTDHVDVSDKTDGVTIRDSIGREQNPIFINESGLYSLIFSSKLPDAKKFKHWVTSEVLPTIRKHGAFMTPAVIEEALMNPDFIMRLAGQLKAEQEKNKVLEEKIAEDKPKTVFADAVSASHTSILIGDLAKLLRQNGVDMGQNRLFAWMRDNGYLCKKGSMRNMPTQRSIENGWFEIKENAICNPDGIVKVTKTPKVTGAGQVYFINLFLKDKESNENTEGEK